MDLDQPDQALEKFRSTLEDDELQRAARFYFDKHRRHFIAGRGFLRSLVGRYLGTKAKTRSVLIWSVWQTRAEWRT